MSDWSMYEIEDAIWDVFGACSDHVIPRPSADFDNETKAQHDSNKKARHDLRNTADEMADKAGFGEHSIFQENGEIVFNSSSEDYMAIADQNNVGHFSHEISSFDTDIGFIKDENMEMKNSGVLDDEWPGFDDFEDVDHMFRHGYPTFGQGGGDPANELSWFSSSSYTIDDSEDTLKSSLQSSCSEFNVPKTYSNHHEAGMSNWPEKVADIDDYEASCLDHDSYGQWVDADAQNNLVSEKMPNDFSIDGSSLSSTINSTNPNYMDTYQVNGERTMAMGSHIEGINLDQNSGYFSGSYNSSGQSACYDNKLGNPLETSTPESCIPGMVEDLNDFIGMQSSNYLSLHGSNIGVMHNEASQILRQLKPIRQPLEIKPLNSNKFVDQALSKSEKLAQKFTEKVEKLSSSQHRDLHQNAHSSIPTADSAEWKASENVSSKSTLAQNELNKLGNHTGDDSELEVGDATVAFSTMETNNSSVQGSSCTTSSGSIISGSSSLQKLQEVTSQLDLKIKLCIRDGLYRLARNAKQRHNPDIIRYGCKEEMITSNFTVANDSNRCPRLLYEETGTNPIDRSIAYLLFYRASGHCVGPADDAMSA